MKLPAHFNICFFVLMLTGQLYGQSVGIGTTSPNASAQLDVSSNNKGLLTPRMSSVSRNAIVNPAKGLMVYDTTHAAFFYFDGGTWRPVYEKNYDSATVDYSATAAASTIMQEGTSGLISITSSTDNGFIYDPGGPAGNYPNNNNTRVNILNAAGASPSVAIKIIVEEMDIESFHDSLFIISLSTTTGLPPDTIAALSGNQTGTYIIINQISVTSILFKSDNAFNLPGFKIRWGRIKPAQDLQIAPPLYGWHFDNKKVAAMGGLQGSNNNWATDSVGFGSFSYGFNNRAKGDYAVATGYYTTASGSYSTASGAYTTASGYASTTSGYVSTASGYASTASGDYSTASGYYSTASGEGSTASGYASTASGYSSTASGNYSTASGAGSTASGQYSTASGTGSIASGQYSTARGLGTTASGDYSTALGRYVTARGAGSFAIGDASTTTMMDGGTDNRMYMRFARGYQLYTTSDLSVGMQLPAGGNSWSAISDMRRKEKFLPVNGEGFLQKIAAMPLTTWNYKGQDSKTFRHYGPMAQDFYEAFGKDDLGTIGSDTLINQQDFLGVNLIAIQALEKRTQVLQKENEALKNKNDELEKLVLLIKKELDELKKR